uniref:TFIIS N-terminal domain-containing protein n=1 Tax=Arundo donax TaxID=35708 RepID=A0A0A8Y843_ARUDO
MGPPPSLDYWRGFFRGARASIFDAIDAAIRVAAADHPDGLRARRDAIAERLYTALVSLPPAEAPGLPAPGPPLTRQLLPEGAGSVPSLCSSDRTEAVTDDSRGGGGGAAPRNNSDDPVVAEAFRVKAALSNTQEKSVAELLELLGRLRQMEFTVDAIMATEIGMAVKPLRKHSSKQIRQLVRSLIKDWKTTVHEWMSHGGSTSIVDHTPQSMDTSCLEQEGGLPAPPMDEAALFTTPCTSILLSEFFDEMDDDGNIRSNAKERGQCYPANQESVKKQSPMGQWYDPEQNWRLDQSAVKQSRPNEQFNWETRQKSNTRAQGKPSSAAFGPGRPQMLHLEPRGSEMRATQQQDGSVAQRRLKPSMPNRPSTQHDENSVWAKLELAKDAKLEAAKRKLQEGYQEFKNAKKQRTIQMLDPQDLPKQGNRNLPLNGNGKPRNNRTCNIRNQLGIRR